MVSNAREDLPDPETPVTTVKALFGISKSMFLRLWTRAPRTTMLSLEFSDIGNLKAGQPKPIARRSATEEPERPAETFYYSGGCWCGGMQRNPSGIKNEFYAYASLRTGWKKFW